MLIDGQAVRSCVTPIGTIGQSEVTTIEGLGTADKPYPLQRAFIDEQAAQCGYCIDGMVMTAKGLLDRASGVVRGPRAYAAVNSGQIINPDGLTNQIEGGIIQSTSWTLKEQVRFTPDGIASRDWESYPILTMPEVPIVEVELVDGPTERPLGAGEASQGPTVAAIANAFAHATGRRLRDLPFAPARVKAALG